MLGQDNHRKVTASHLQRGAFLYIRQSTPKQVFENIESTQRQYALRDRAIALGWPHNRIRIIDNDLGLSGSSAGNREGFKTLVSEVGMGHAGIVMGLEVSRLARNSTEWHRLVEICALTDTLILDEDGVYDPAQFNDRLLLGMKGTFSEAELHVLRARLRGGILNKAARAELEISLPAGLAYDLDGKVQLDPDKQVQSAVNLLFETFRRTGSARACVKFFRHQSLKFPRRSLRGGKKAEIMWNDLDYSRVLSVLHNPRYTGAFAYGRTSFRRAIDGKGGKVRKKEQGDWLYLIKDSHPGYISWEEFERNQALLLENSEAHALKRGAKGPPREGPALLQGLVVCGQCGRRMTIRYHFRRGRISPDYVCQREGINLAKAICQSISGDAIDAALGQVIVEAMTPGNTQTALRVQDEIQQRLEEADALRRSDVERAQYEVDSARRRYMHVDPSNRLVADALEADWNTKIQKLREAQETYDKRRESEVLRLTDEKKAEIRDLATSFPKLWSAPETTDRERKRMARLVIQDVTLRKSDHVYIGVQFRGGAVKELVIPLPKNAFDECKTHSQIIDEIDRLLETHSDHEIAELFNARGWLTGKGHSFNRNRVERIRAMYSLKTRFERLRERGGWLTASEMAAKLGVTRSTVNRWAEEGRIEARTYKKKLCLYADPGENAPKPMPRDERLRLANHARLAGMAISKQ